MNEITRGSAAGAIGALILAAIMYAMFLAGSGTVPGFVGIYQKMFGPGDGLPAHILGTIGFTVAGAVWGTAYALLIKNPGIVSGMLYGFVPTLFVWLVISPLMSGTSFNGFAVKGLILPVVFNVLIWGSFVGWFLSRRPRSIQPDV